jgi:hypothetical protein
MEEMHLGKLIYFLLTRSRSVTTFIGFLNCSTKSAKQAALLGSFPLDFLKPGHTRRYIDFFILSFPVLACLCEFFAILQNLSEFSEFDIHFLHGLEKYFSIDLRRLKKGCY